MSVVRKLGKLYDSLDDELMFYARSNGIEDYRERYGGIVYHWYYSGKHVCFIINQFYMVMVIIFIFYQPSAAQLGLTKVILFTLHISYNMMSSTEIINLIT